MMGDIAGWIAPVATMIAAIMTAANLGSRITGWGFVVFTVGSVSWSLVGIATGQDNLLLTNGFLTIVNLVGVWRWLGRQAKIEDGSDRAARRSSAANVPTLFSGAALPGSPVLADDGTKLGTIVDVMSECDTGAIAYAVVSDGGLGGMDEVLRAVTGERLQFCHRKITTTLSTAAFRKLPALEPDDWPASAGAA